MFPNDVVWCPNPKSDQLMPTFKEKGQIYHRAGSLLSFSEENHKFLQFYFISDRNSELNTRCEISHNLQSEK